MTRILQIRRGTTAQNDNFTGLAGEITMDTTKKTVRIHDGETLGGFALARVDDIPESGAGEPFDINSVPASFWQNLFETYSEPKVQSFSSTPQNIINGISFFDESFDDFTTLPLYATAFLVCQSDDAGYVSGDETCAFGIGDYATPLVYTYIGNYVAHARLFVGSQNFWVPHKSSGTKTNITISKWKVKITVYY